MGNRLSGLIASLYLDRLEKQVIRNLPIRCYSRYVDDIFFFTSSPDEATVILNAFNAAADGVRFELECPGRNSLSLLDFTVTVEATSQGHKASFQFFRKAARSDVFLHYQAAIPASTRMAAIRNERQRIADRNTCPAANECEQTKLDSRLIANGYPSAYISQSRTQARRRRPRRDNNSQPLHLSIPYIDDRLDHKLNNVFKKYGLNVRIVHRSKTLRHLLQNRQTSLEKCTIRGCVVQAQGICFFKNCVYSIKCTSCDEEYIGSSTRFLHERIREHRQKDTAVSRHSRTCRANFKVSVLTRQKDEVNTRLAEGFFIRKLKPQLNTMEEVALWSRYCV